MPTSIRLDPQLERRLREVAERESMTLSAVAREAIREYCEKKRPATLYDALKDVIGTVESDYLCAERTSEAFTELLLEEHQRDSH